MCKQVDAPGMPVFAQTLIDGKNMEIDDLHHQLQQQQEQLVRRHMDQASPDEHVNRLVSLLTLYINPFSTGNYRRLKSIPALKE